MAIFKLYTKICANVNTAKNDAVQRRNRTGGVTPCAKTLPWRSNR